MVLFTDEPTQNMDGIHWTNAQACSLLSGKTTIHTIYSSDTTYYSWNQYNERPWEVSIWYWRTYKFIPYNAAGLSLKDLPVAGALANSYLVEYVTSQTGKAHTVKVTVSTPTADGVQTFNVTY